MIKKYVLEVNIKGGILEIATDCEGFAPLELLGLLAWKQQDIIDQMKGNVKPDIVKRGFVEEATANEK